MTSVDPAAKGRAGAALRMRLLGVGAMNSPRYRPAGLLLAWGRRRVMFDGGDDAAPSAAVDAWLVTDASAELISDIRRRARALGVTPIVDAWSAAGLRIHPLPVAHTSHPTFGYLIEVAARRVVWAPEFWRFPEWAAGADLMFADASGWERPIRFVGGVGGHAAVLDTAEQARRDGIARLIFAHIGRPSIRARDAGQRPPFGTWGDEGHLYRLVAPAPAEPPTSGSSHRDHSA
jgi:hypothetical protein